MSAAATSAGGAPALNGGRLGWPRVHERRLDSTNERARLLALSGADVTVEATLACVLEWLERRLAESPAAVVAAWRLRDALLGERIRWQQGTGVAAGIDDDGSLIVRPADGVEVRLDAGEVH